MVEPAIDALNSALRDVGNASSLHSQGRAVRKRVEESREAIAAIVGARASEIIFTGSGTEANNLAIKGFYWKSVAENPHRNIILTSAVEHHAIIDPVEWLVEHEGARWLQIPVTNLGMVDLEALTGLLDMYRDEIALVSVMHSNNELGTIQPILEVLTLAGEIPVHCDAVQSFGKVDFSFKNLGVTAATISAHKIGGPLGIAALVLRGGVDITPVLHGGGQERDLRSGTINAPAITAFAEAAKYAEAHRQSEEIRISQLRERFVTGVTTIIPEARVNGASPKMLPGIANITFPGTENESLLLLLDQAGISCSTGSACSAGVHRPSHVLLALGMSERDVMSTLRFSLGRITTEEEIDFVLSEIGPVVARAQVAAGSMK
jgi:cysteine desulfurase